MCIQTINRKKLRVTRNVIGAAAFLLAQTTFSAPGLAQNGPVKTAGVTQAELDILKLARQKFIDILVDTTKLTEIPFQPVPAKLRGPESSVNASVEYYADAYRLSIEPFGGNTFFFWSEPDEDAIARAVASGQGFGLESGTMGAVELGQKIHEALANQAGETKNANAEPIGAQGQGEFIKEEFPLTQMPLDIQQQLVFLVLRRGLAPLDELWFRDEAWKRASISYRPANPKVTGSFQSLLLSCALESSIGRSIMHLDAFSGGISGNRFPTDAPAKTHDAQKEAVLQTAQWRIGTVPGLANPDGMPDALVSTPPRPIGAAFQALMRSRQGVKLATLPELSAPLILESSHQPLSRLLQQVSAKIHVTLACSPEVEAQKSSLTAHIQSMKVGEFLDALAHLYGLIWVKGEGQSFVLTKNLFADLETELIQFGKFALYRFRDNNSTAWDKNKADFDQVAASIVDQAGEAILKSPGIPFSSLPAEMQASLRKITEKALSHDIIRNQIRARDLLQGDWAFRLTGRMTAPEPNAPPAYEALQLECFVNGRGQSVIPMDSRPLATSPNPRRVPK